MTFDPILNAPVAVQTHVFLALVALGLGPFVVWRSRRDKVHKALGYIWFLAFVGAAAVSFAIPTNFQFLEQSITPLDLGPIHLLSIYALVGAFQGLTAILKGQITDHQRIMRGLYLQAVVLVSAITLMPGRIMQRTLIPDTPEIGYAVLIVALLWVFWPTGGGDVGRGSDTPGQVGKT